MAPVKARQLLRRGVRMELYLAPLLIVVPILVGTLLIDLGAKTGRSHVQALGVVVLAGNLVFDYLMVVTAVRFLRSLGPTEGERPGGGERPS